jgi:hypothetical protein
MRFNDSSTAFICQELALRVTWLHGRIAAPWTATAVCCVTSRKDCVQVNCSTANEKSRVEKHKEWKTEGVDRRARAEGKQKEKGERGNR